MSKSFRSPTRRLAPLAAALLLTSAPARAQTSIGSFVSGERPMYLEIDQFADGQPFHVKFMNVPAGSSGQTLFLSDHYFPAAYAADTTTPGSLGPDLVYGQTIAVGSNDYSGTVTKGKWSGIVYVQGYVNTPAGGRLTSMVECHPKEATTSSPGVSIVFPLPLTTQEVLRPAKKGVDAKQLPVRVGVPLPRGQVFEKSGEPQLTLVGPKVGQFTTLAKWGDGSCKWVLCEYLEDLAPGALDTSVKVDRGAGDFGGAALATTSGSVTTIDTGALQVTVDSTKDDLLQSVKSAGRDLVSTSAGNRPHFFDDKDVEWTWHKTAVNVRRNGPVRAEVEVDGSFTRSTSSTDPDRVYARFYLEACKGLSTLRATVSLRDTSLQYPVNLLFRGFTYRFQLNESGLFDVRMPLPVTNGDSSQLATGSIGSGQDSCFSSGFVRTAKTLLQTDATSNQYYGFVHRDPATGAFALTGVAERIGSSQFCGSAATSWRSPVDQFCDPSFLESNSTSSGRGVLVGLEHACRTCPVELQAGGDGRVEIGVLPHKATSDTTLYPLAWASAETRAFDLSFESAKAVDPFAVATSFDYPLAARCDLWVYNQAEVWPWKLVTPSEVTTYQTLANIRTNKPYAENAVRTVYRYSGGTGGGNNNWGETRSFLHWLRTGDGGAYLSSFFEAVYKADQMAWNVDDGSLSQRSKVRNPTAPVTAKPNTYDGSKHVFMQAVPDWAFSRGECCLFDAAKPLAETILDKQISMNVQPYGAFQPCVVAAVTNAACAVLELAPNQTLDDWTRLVLFQYCDMVYQQKNNFGVNTATMGWQAPVGTPEGSATNPDGYVISWNAGKSSYRAQYGYMSQQWTDLRQTALTFSHYAHHLRDVAPSDPLISDLRARATDVYHYAHRGLPDDHNSKTGEHYILDVFKGDAGNPNAAPLSAPGDWIAFPNPSGYANQTIVNFLLDQRASESAYSYGVELNRSMSNSTFDQMVNDPGLDDFMWRFLVHYGQVKP